MQALVALVSPNTSLAFISLPRTVNWLQTAEYFKKILVASRERLSNKMVCRRDHFALPPHHQKEILV